MPLRKSEAWKTGTKRYLQSPKGKAAMARSKKRYRQSVKGKESIRAYRERNRDRCRMYGREWARRHPESQKAWRDAHPEQVRGYRQHWAECHPEKVRRAKANVEALRRARKLSLPYEKIDRHAIYDRDGGRCWLCHRKVSRRAFHLEHCVPLSKGGAHTAANVAVSHPRCNVRKQNKLVPVQGKLALCR